MKYRIIILLIAAIASTSCKSNEQKAEALIREQLSKTLYDYESYEPIETIVTEAYETPYNSPECILQALEIADHIDKAEQYIDEATNALEYAAIWGAPTYYSSSYSDSQYYKYKAQAEENEAAFREEFEAAHTMGLALQDYIQAMNPEQVVGWEVRHRFRCKTRGGMSDIGDYRYIVDKKFENIIFYEDMDGEDSSRVRNIIASAENNEFDIELAE